MAELTRRVFHLEQLLRTGAATDTTEKSAPSPVESEPLPALARAVPHRRATLANRRPAWSSARRKLIPQATPSPKTEVSLETRIGGQWLNRVGIVAVLVGLSYFLKLAIENNWIGPGMRVAIGIVAGHCAHPVERTFSHARLRDFRVFPEGHRHWRAVPVAVGGLPVLSPVTGDGGFPRDAAGHRELGGHVAAQDSELLAAFALVGGFLTPVLVSTNQNHEIALFSYVALLDLGTVWVVAVRGWQRLLLGSFVGTTLLFAAWASSYYTESQLATTLAFASFFFLLYAGAPFLGRKSATERRYPNVLVVLALLNASSYFAASYADAE